jgi:hypothetical protein
MSYVLPYEGDAMRSRGGRKPRVPGACSSMRLSIRLTPEERRDLEAVARENHTNLADVLREAVNEYVADYRERPLFEPVSASMQPEPPVIPSVKSKG